MTRHYGARLAPPWSRSRASRTPIASSSSPAKRHRRLRRGASVQHGRHAARLPAITREIDFVAAKHDSFGFELRTRAPIGFAVDVKRKLALCIDDAIPRQLQFIRRSEEHTSELQSLMRISYAVFCLQKKNKIEPHS